MGNSNHENAIEGAKPFYFKLTTPMGKIEECAITVATLPGASGEFGVMHGHMSLVSLLKDGKVSFTKVGGEKRLYDITGGIAHVDGNKLTLLVDNATCRV